MSSWSHPGSSGTVAGPALQPARRRHLSPTFAVAVVTLLAVGGLTVADATPAAPAAAVTVPTDPYRVLDTRSGIGTGGASDPLGPGQAITLQVAGVGPVPSNAGGIVINLTVADGDEPGSYITAWPTGTQRPDTSVINIVPGQATANMITANLGGGRLDLYNFRGHVHLIADVAGYLLPAGDTVGAAGPQGPVGPQGPAGPPGPTAASYGQEMHLVGLPGAGGYRTVSQLDEAGSGGRLVTTFASRIVISGAVTLWSPTTIVNVVCQLQVDDGSGFVDVGHYVNVRLDPVTGYGHPVVPINAVADRPAGSFDVRLVCRNNTLDSSAVADEASLNVIAVART